MHTISERERELTQSRLTEIIYGTAFKFILKFTVKQCYAVLLNHDEPGHLATTFRNLKQSILHSSMFMK